MNCRRWSVIGAKLFVGAASLVAFDTCTRPENASPEVVADRTVAAPARAPAGAGGQASMSVPVTEPALAAPAPAPEVTPREQGPCPASMVFVEGEYCTNVDQECLQWEDDPVKTPYARCQRFRDPSGCRGERVHLRFCVDRDEFTRPGEDLPVGDVSWTQARETCAASGKRLCAEREWVLACEGNAMVPYPYGYERDPSACNFDNTDLTNPDGSLRDGRRPATADPRCLSPYGVHDMVGNVDEWVVLDKPHYSQKNGNRKMMSGLKGGWWGPYRNRCRPTTVDHDEVFHELQTGFRCCGDPT